MAAGKRSVVSELILDDDGAPPSTIPRDEPSFAPRNISYPSWRFRTFQFREPSSTSLMKRSLLVVSSLALACCTFALSPASAASSRENQRLHEGKITKNQAQHLVLKKYPRASIRKCELTRGKAHSIWVLHVVPAGAHDLIEVKIDGRSGKILP